MLSFILSHVSAVFILFGSILIYFTVYINAILRIVLFIVTLYCAMRMMHVQFNTPVYLHRPIRMAL